MKTAPLLAVLIASMQLSLGQEPFQAEMTPVEEGVFLEWPTTLNKNYQVLMSPDLQTFLDTGIVEPGTGSEISYGFMTTDNAKMFFRVHTTRQKLRGEKAI
ncbi:hypothetical protein [Roseibacillus ishigakijimensis]|uniref:Uncharacterized protein n=1 Tax=Roseibacillus ishigakijimensis TaxID=454146 RepID=A0A934VLG5_9BACT|nr:hypothetical protein [Roseibacillus ishigakijimensis]MBK1834664.1 hypothetical protein [Roseibacillus ishigakijimensis]